MGVFRERCFSSCHELGKKKISESSRGSELQTFGFRAPIIYQWAKTNSTVSEVYHKVHMTRVLHTARISNVDGVMFVIEIKNMVSFELGKETEKDVFLHVTSVGKRNTSESPWGIEPQTFGFHAHRSLWGSVLEHPSADLSLFLHRTQNLQSL